MFISADRPSDFMLFAFFFIVCFSLYFSGLNNDFIFDDNFLIINNPYVKNFNISKIFTTDIFHFKPKELSQGNYYYRPLQSLSYSWEYILWKLNPIGYRTTNILLHSLNSLFIFLLIYLIFKDKILALLSSIFFCIHPAQACLVTFIAGRSNLLETFFTLSSILAFVYCLAGYGKKSYYFSLLLYVAAVLSREGALLLPLYLITCLMFFKLKKRKIILLLAPYVAVSLLYIMIRHAFFPFDNSGIFPSLSLHQLFNFALRLHDYFWQLVLTLNLKVELFNKHYMVKFIFYFLSSLMSIYFLTKAIISKDKVIFYGLFLYFIGLTPLIKLDENLNNFGPILSEHYVYNASIGFSLLLAYSILWLNYNYRKLEKIIFIIITLFFSSSTIMLSSNYKNEFNFYKYVLHIDKNNTIARLNLGNVYYTNKDYNQASIEARRVLELEPNAWDAYLLLGNISKDKNDFDKAIELYKRALILNPKSDITLNNLGSIYKMQDKFDKALEYFNKAFTMNPESSIALLNMAELFIKNNKYKQAFAVCEKILELYPDNVNDLVAIGVWWAETEYFKESEFFLKRALRLAPTSYDAMKNLASMYGNMGDFDKAIFYFKKALEVRPQEQELKELLYKSIKLKNRWLKNN